MSHPRTAEFNIIVNGSDYFTAALAHGWVRVGLVGCAFYDFPVGHSLNSRVSACLTEDEAEAIFDECVDRYSMEAWA